MNSRAERKALSEKISGEGLAGLRRHILAFTWPVMSEFMLLALMGAVSVSMVGHLGASAIAAVGLATQSLTIIIFLLQGFNTGATALVARFIGANDKENAGQVVGQTVLFGALFGVIFGAPSYIVAERLVKLMGTEEAVVPVAAIYLRFVAAMLPLKAISMAIASTLRGAGETRAPMIYNLLSSAQNVLVGALLIRGGYGIPALGVMGAGAAAFLAEVTSLLLALRALRSRALPFEVPLKEPITLDLRMLVRIGRIGISAAAEQLIMRIGFLVYVRIIAHLGTVPFAAHQIAQTISTFAFNAVTALGIASSSFVGRSLGSETPELARRYCDEINYMGACLSIGFGLMCLFFGEQLSALFSTDQQVILLCTEVLKVIALIAVPQSVLQILVGGLRGAGDTVWPMYSAIVGTLFMRILMAAFFVLTLKLGVVGAWTAALLDQCIRALLIWHRYRSNRWQLIRV